MTVGAVMLLVAPRGKGFGWTLAQTQVFLGLHGSDQCAPNPSSHMEGLPLCSDSGLSYPAIANAELQPHFILSNILVTIQSSVRMETQSVVGQPSSVCVSGSSR